LEQSSKFLDSVIENIPNMIFVKDAKTLRFIRFNRAGEELLGYSRRELLGKSDYDLFPPEQANEFTRRDRLVLESGKMADIPQEPVTTRHQGVRYLHTKKLPVPGPRGEPRYLLGISEDITEIINLEQERLKLVQEQVARAEAEKTAERLRFLSEASAALSASLDLSSTLESFAKIVIRDFCDFCEIVLVEDGHLKVEDFVVAHKDSKKAEWAKKYRSQHSVSWDENYGIGQVVRTGEPEIYPRVTPEQVKTIANTRHREAAELMHVHSAMLVPLQYYGRVLGVMSLLRTENPLDFTPLDLSLALDLARRAAYAVENARLFRKAQEASEAKSAFLANMSHEIRTPLGAMLGFAELMTDGELAQQQQKYLSTILKNGRQLLRIVDEILDLSKVESDRISIEEIEFSFPTLIEEVLSLLEVQARDRNLEFRVRVPEHLPERLITDPTRLRQILINVIGNAIKFTSEGFVEVQISLLERLDLPNRPVLQIKVTDTGIGIPPEHQEKLFQPFSQADKSMNRRFGGTGLGLSLSRRMARLLGGDVTLGQSETQAGSQFIITLGVQLPTRPAMEGEAPHTAPGSETGDLARGRVLIVDDAPDNRTLIQHYVARLGYEADTAETGREAVEKALSGEFDVILMDVQMPEMDGFEAVSELRTRSYRKPIVALTAHTMKGDRERCLEGGFDDFLGKPVDREQLRESLRRYAVHPTP
jgi:PAS domain S-box-containing protein